jgi:hypothetical protein
MESNSRIMQQYMKTSHILVLHTFNSVPNLVELRIQSTHNGEN